MKPSVAVREYLASEPAITTIAGTRIWADVIWPVGYNVTQGPALLIQTLGGPNPYRGLDMVIAPRIQFQSMAQSMTLARDLDEAIHPLMDRIVGRSAVTVAPSLVAALVEMRGAEMPHPETGWRLVVSAYIVTLKRTA